MKWRNHSQDHSGAGGVSDQDSVVEKIIPALTIKVNKAFTLAEVLITLGIIGVVAAMTIPTLVQSYKKKVVESRLVKFYSTMQQAIKLSEIENGPISTWDEIGTGCEFVDPEAEKKRVYRRHRNSAYLV